VISDDATAQSAAAAAATDAAGDEIAASSVHSDCQTFRKSPLMPERTICTPQGEGAGLDLRGRPVGPYLQHCDRVAVLRKFNTD